MAVRRGSNRNKEEVFLKSLSKLGSVRKACMVAGVSREWVRRRKHDKDFNIAYQDALDDSVDRVEEVATSLALRGDDKLIRYLLDKKRYSPTASIDSGVTPIINISVRGKNVIEEGVGVSGESEL